MHSDQWFIRSRSENFGLGDTRTKNKSMPTAKTILNIRVPPRIQVYQADLNIVVLPFRAENLAVALIELTVRARAFGSGLAHSKLVTSVASAFK